MMSESKMQKLAGGVTSFRKLNHVKSSFSGEIQHPYVVRLSVQIAGTERITWRCLRLAILEMKWVAFNLFPALLTVFHSSVL